MERRCLRDAGAQTVGGDVRTVLLELEIAGRLERYGAALVSLV